MTARTVTTLIRLAPGEALHLPLDARSTLQVAAGTVVLREPLRWLADTVVAPVVALSESECHRLAHAGWVVVEAGEGGADVRSLRRPAAVRSLWKALFADRRARATLAS
ncbi:hypothetical protein [Variovorax sp. PAMC 28711]|uniref:hypothetical protein n=1 Tax=Variovorax sp. PAMC 28711 TaxID=1795631 RepID=UPI00078E906E|nr:hypothetical protein [Variovorax sp. PAMC 28711]AMM24658.1 hypothetical protein AX767_10090 [Variovorax sp. PAMC 28711]